MEYIANHLSICPLCDNDILPGQTIAPYGGLWYHGECRENIDYKPRLGQVGMNASERMRQKIIALKREYPCLTVRAIADELNTSKSTIGRALQGAGIGAPCM